VEVSAFCRVSGRVVIEGSKNYYGRRDDGDETLEKFFPLRNHMVEPRIPRERIFAVAWYARLSGT